MIAAIGALLEHGLPLIAEQAMGMVETEGVDAAEKWIKNKTGLDFDFNGNDKDKDYDKLIKDNVDTLKRAELELGYLRENNRHEESIIKAAAEEKAVIYKDRADARSMGKVYANSSDELIRRFLPAFSIFLVLIIFVMMGMVIWIPSPNEHIGNIAISVIEFSKTILMLVVGYWFGSSMGSKQKTDIISDISSKPHSGVVYDSTAELEREAMSPYQNGRYGMKLDDVDEEYVDTTKYE